jgi:hypothetical protein
MIHPTTLDIVVSSIKAQGPAAFTKFYLRNVIDGSPSPLGGDARLELTDTIAATLLMYGQAGIKEREAIRTALVRVQLTLAAFDIIGAGAEEAAQVADDYLTARAADDQSSPAEEP